MRDPDAADSALAIIDAIAADLQSEMEFGRYIPRAKLTRGLKRIREHVAMADDALELDG